MSAPTCPRWCVEHEPIDESDLRLVHKSKTRGVEIVNRSVLPGDPQTLGLRTVQIDGDEPTVMLVAIQGNGLPPAEVLTFDISGAGDLAAALRETRIEVVR